MVTDTNKPSFIVLLCPLLLLFTRSQHSKTGCVLTSKTSSATTNYTWTKIEKKTDEESSFGNDFETNSIYYNANINTYVHTYLS